METTPKIIFGTVVPDPSRLTLVRREVRPHPADIRSIEIRGQTGYGKTTSLGVLAKQFSEVGEGVFVPDIRGDLAENLVMHHEEPDRVKYIDFAEAAKAGHYYALNPLDFDRAIPGNVDYYARELPEVIANIGLYDPAIMQEIEKYLTEGVRLAASSPKTSILDVYMALWDDKHRDTLLKSPHVPATTRHFWETIAGGQTAAERRRLRNSTDSRLRSLLGDPILSRMLIQEKTTLKLAEWLDAGYCVIVNLAEGKLGSRTSRLIANLLLGTLATEIKRRPPGEHLRPWRIIVDEVAELAPRPFTNLLTQMRNYSAYPVLAHQNAAQLDQDPLLAAAADQAAFTMYFRQSPQDADIFRRRGQPDLAEVLETLPAGHAYIERDVRARTGWQRGLAGTRRGDLVRLNYWQGPGLEERLAGALRAQLTLAGHKSTLRRVLFDDEQGSVKYGSMKEPNHDRQAIIHYHVVEPPGPGPLQTGEGEALSHGDDPDGMGGAGPPLPPEGPDRDPALDDPVRGPGDNRRKRPRGRRRAQGGQ
jgi:hypothetical protein